MMKKFGFTLAEVLITLGIIGVVAALTAPALVKNTSGAQIGPTLAKVSSTLENAHQRMMTDEDASDLAKLDGNFTNYMETLAKYISGSSYETDFFDSSDFEPAAEYYDGTNFRLNGYYRFNFSDSITLLISAASGVTKVGDRYLVHMQYYTPKGSFKGQFGIMYVDINGVQTKPNVVGRDIFGFYIDSSGKILPMGSKTFAWMKIGGLVSVGQAVLSNSWEDNSGTYACNETVVTKGKGCAGSIFDNNLKVIYQ